MSNIKTIDIAMSGLNPKQVYKFNFSNKGGNWPVKVTPLSGTISGVYKPDNLKTFVYFCPNTGLCPKNDPSVFYNLPSGDVGSLGLSVGSHSLYSVLQLDILDSNNTNVYSYPCMIQCDSCLPQLSISSDTVTLDATTGSKKDLSIIVDGLIPNQEYRYNFTGLNGNWPMKILPTSGTIKTSNSSFSINALASFCNTSGNCINVGNILPYEKLENCNNNEELYSIVELSVTPINVNYSTFQSATKSSFSVVCNNCLPKTKAILPTSLEFNNTTLAKQTINATLTDLVIGEQYDYSISGVAANWPVILYPTQGSITATSTSMTVPFRMTFCQSTGICPSGAVNVQPYTVDTYRSYGNSQLDRVSKVRMQVNRSCDSNTVYSNEMMVVCNDCLPIYRAKFNDGPVLSLNLTCCSGIKALGVSVSGAIPYQDYSYVFTASDNTIEMSPITGVVQFDRTGIGTVTSVSNSVLTRGQVKFIDFEITNNLSNEKAKDRLTVQCGPDTSCS